MLSSYIFIGLTVVIAIPAIVFDLAFLTIPAIAAFIAIAVAYWRERKNGLALLYTFGSLALLIELIGKSLEE